MYTKFLSFGNKKILLILFWSSQFTSSNKLHTQLRSITDEVHSYGMKFSLNWLREFVETEGLDPQKIGDSLTLHTCEVEGIIHVASNFDHVFAGKLISVKAHPKADKLHLGIFDCGKKGKKQIVFGEVFELTKGEIYPVALNGAKLASGIEITDTEVRGVKSEGMVCTCPELGMKQETLLKFETEDIGKTLPEIVPEFGDILFDIDNKSLTHRPDLMGHRGLAREMGAIWNKEFESEIFAPELTTGKPFPVKIETDKCRRFCAIKLENITLEPSDLATQAKLENIDIRAISNLVDLTNVSLAGFGQPMHVFDADKLKGGITIRLAKKGEKLLALDDEEYELKETDIVVADDEKVLSIAGIMGGIASSVTSKTKNIVFESANFDAASIRHTSSRLGLRSESSARYEKSLDPKQCLEAILWAVGKTQQLCPDAKIASSVGDAYPHPFGEMKIDLPPDLVRMKSGLDISNEDITEKLRALGFDVESTGATLKVVVPSWRATKDIEIPEDLVEEIVRLHGFDAVPSVLPTLPLTPPKRNKLREMEWKIRDILVNAGRNEIYLSSFVGPKDPEWTEDKSHVCVQNGANEEYEKLRLTLVSNAVRGMESELRTHGELNFFEIGTVFPKIEHEKRKLLLLSAAMNGDAPQKFFEQKTELIHVFRSLGVEVEINVCKKPHAIFHPAQCADISIDGKVLGQIFVLHPKKNPVRGAIVVATEIDLKMLETFVSLAEMKHVPISQFPTVYRDLSLVMANTVQQSDILSAAKAASKYLKDITLFDVFIDEKRLGKEKKNLAFHLSFQAKDKTLDEKTIDTEFDAIHKALEKKFKTQLRLDFDTQNS